MKKTLTLLVLLISSLGLFAQTYVNINATGSDNGSSWQDAYLSLETAILQSNEGDELWIAAGTYLAPETSASDDVYFQIVHDVSLYGGFDGTETARDQRNPEVNISILSGDQNQDDVAGNFSTNREDNNRRVMWIEAGITNATIIDGLTLMGGVTEGSDASDNDRRGGAILSFGAPIINNCIFTGNYGFFGGVYTRGADATGAVITNSEFLANGGGNGAGIFTTAAIEISDCLFEDNVGDRRGLGVYVSNRNCTITNCEFKNNTSNGSSGGALHVVGSEDNTVTTEVAIVDCVFDGNSSSFGGAVSVYDSMLIATFTNCVFENNSSLSVGGASSNGFGATTNFDNCTFKDNFSNFGGAVFNQDDDGEININNCLFNANEAMSNGGALSVSGDALAPDALTQVNVNNSMFLLNSAGSQGGAINTGSAEIHITNSLFDFNFISGTETSIGGAISINNGDDLTMNNSITNSTIVNSIAAIGAGISHWTDGSDLSISTLTLQNTIMLNTEGANYQMEDGDPIFVSNGGNLSADDSMLDFLTSTNDLNETDPVFLEEIDKEYYLAEASPAINSGVATGAPLTDILGNPRVDEVDMGAYEFQGPVGVSNYLAKNANLDIFPNPVSEDVITFELSGELTGLLLVEIMDNLGQTLQSSRISATAEKENFTLKIPALERGLYFLKISDGNKLITRSFISL